MVMSSVGSSVGGAVQLHPEAAAIGQFTLYGDEVHGCRGEALFVEQNAGIPDRDIELPLRQQVRGDLVGELGVERGGGEGRKGGREGVV